MMNTSLDPVVTGRALASIDAPTTDAFGHAVVAQALVSRPTGEAITLAELPPVTVNAATIIVSELMEELALALPVAPAYEYEPLDQVARSTAMTPISDPLDRYEEFSATLATNTDTTDMEAIVDRATGSIATREFVTPYVPHEVEDALTSGLAHPYVRRHTLKLPGRI